MADDTKDSRSSGNAGPGNPFGLPNFDLRELLTRFQPPGFDLERLMASERKNVEALQSANRAVMEGWEALAEKQGQVFRDTLDRWQKATQAQLSGQPPDLEAQAEMAREGFQQALDNMREMAEITARSQSEAYEIMRNRMEENIEAYFQSNSPSNRSE
jgi:phasin family protein